MMRPDATRGHYWSRAGQASCVTCGLALLVIAADPWGWSAGVTPAAVGAAALGAYLLASIVMRPGVRR